MSRRLRSDYRLSLGWILGVTFMGTLTRLKLPQWSSLSFGAAVCLRLPPHTTSRRKLSRLATDQSTCSCLRLTVATNSPRKGLSPPIQCPCRAHSSGHGVAVLAWGAAALRLPAGDPPEGAGCEIAHPIPVGSPRRILSAAIADRRNILIAGATGSGKTTLLNACLDQLAHIAPKTRLITIEDTPEIRVPLKNTLGLRSSPDVSMDRLLVSTLRLAPDRIVVGEVREGAVLMTLIKAWDTGHPGGLTTLHANSAAEVVPRLKMLATEVLASDPTQRLMESLDMIVFLRRGRHRPVVETIIAMHTDAGGTRTMETAYET